MNPTKEDLTTSRKIRYFAASDTRMEIKSQKRSWSSNTAYEFRNYKEVLITKHVFTLRYKI